MEFPWQYDNSKWVEIWNPEFHWNHHGQKFRPLKQTKLAPLKTLPLKFELQTQNLEL